MSVALRSVVWKTSWWEVGQSQATSQTSWSSPFELSGGFVFLPLRTILDPPLAEARQDSPQTGRMFALVVKIGEHATQPINFRICLISHVLLMSVAVGMVVGATARALSK
jgi:hypothetical protein